MPHPFPIGAWNRFALDELTPAHFADWAEAGITLTHSPDFQCTQPGACAQLRPLLDRAQAQGLRFILRDRDLAYYSPLVRDEAAYRQHVRTLWAEFGTHPAVAGLFAGDEPRAADWEYAERAVRVQQEEAPQWLSWLNHHPWYPGLAPIVGRSSATEMIDRFLAGSHARILSFDCYSQMNPGREGYDGNGWDMWFANLHAYASAAQRDGCTLWVFLLGSGHYFYRLPSEDEYRWQMSTALAYGVKGIFWFLLHQGEPLDNYRSPIDENGVRRPAYYAIASLCRQLHAYTGSLLLQLVWERVEHLGHSYGGGTLFQPDDLVQDLRAWSRDLPHSPYHHADGRRDLLLARYHHPDGTPYLLLVNNDPWHTVAGTIVLRGTTRRLARIGRGGQPVETTLDIGTDTVAACHFLGPGQMELYAVLPR